MSRFFTEQFTPDGASAVITGDDVKHIAKVLRLREGDAVEICDGKGLEYSGVISKIGAAEVLVTVGKPVPSAAEARHRVTLFQGYPKAGKLETVIQKCTELGVDRVVPVVTKRSVAVPSGDSASKLTRWNRVAEEAAKQSRRGRIPQVTAPIALKEVSLAGFDTALVAYEGERSVTLKQALQRVSGDQIALFIGPEGGFAAEEIDFLKEGGAVSVTLGARILRTETAGPAMLAQVLYELE